MSRDIFKLKNLFTIEDLIKARVHLGHKESMLNGHMRPFVYGKRLGVTVIDLDQTASLMKKALNFSAEIAYRNGIILFINKSRQTSRMVERLALECKEFAHCRKWRNQVLSNPSNIFGAITRSPDLVIFFNTFNNFEEEHKAVDIAAKMLIPSIGICDTNSDPRLITYPIPGNDDTPDAIELYCKLFKTAIMNGKTLREKVIDQHGQEYYDKTLLE